MFLGHAKHGGPLLRLSYDGIACLREDAEHDEAVEAGAYAILAPPCLIFFSKMRREGVDRRGDYLFNGDAARLEEEGETPPLAALCSDDALATARFSGPDAGRLLEGGRHREAHQTLGPGGLRLAPGRRSDLLIVA